MDSVSSASATVASSAEGDIDGSGSASGSGSGSEPVSSGGIEALLHDMIGHVVPVLHTPELLGHAPLCIMLLRTFTALCTDDRRRAAVGLEAAAIITIMKRHEADHWRADKSDLEQLREVAWSLLRNLAACAENAPLLCSVKVPDIAVAALNGGLVARSDSPECAQVVEHACSVIASLFTQDSSAATLPVYGGMTAVVAALNGFVVEPAAGEDKLEGLRAYSTEVAVAAFAALDALSSSYVRNWQTIYAAGDKTLRGLDLDGNSPAIIIAALTYEVASVRACEHACRALVALKGRLGAWWTDSLYGISKATLPWQRSGGNRQEGVRSLLADVNASSVVQTCLLRHAADGSSAAAARAALAAVETISPTY